MKRNDYIKLLCTGLLQVSESQFQALAAFIGQRFEVVALRKPQTVSIGGLSPEQEYLGLIDWTQALRKETIQRVTCFYGSFSTVPLEAHIAAAFAGVEDIILNITTASGGYFYLLQTQYSPANEITPVQLAALVNAQHDPASQWKRLEQLVQESNELNNRPRIAEDSIQNYLLSSEGTQSFEWHAGDFVKELQLNAIITAHDFIIPDHLKHLLQQSSFSFGESGREYTYLYPVAEVSPQQLIALVEAQPFEEKVWQKMENYSKEYPSEDWPAYTSKQWKEHAGSLSAEQWPSFVNMTCRFICECCDEKGIKPVVPEYLKSLFGPDELEAQRIQARSKLDRSQWFLSANSQPWEAYLLERIDYKGPVEQPVSRLPLKNTWQTALKEIEQFAIKIQSNYAEAFRLAHYLLSEDVPSGIFDEVHKETIIKDLQSRSFSERAIENFANVFYYSEELALMHWKAADIHSLWAVSISDVFGGMGSWNDEYFPSEEDRTLHQTLSAALYQALKKYFVSLISFDKQS